VTDPDKPWHAIAAAGGEWWGPLCTDASPASIVAAQAAGLKVNLWGVASDAPSIRGAFALEPDAITLDSPDLARAIDEHGEGG
jgi:glycerophosphoryl diester phosphodiesterase